MIACIALLSCIGVNLFEQSLDNPVCIASESHEKMLVCEGLPKYSSVPSLATPFLMDKNKLEYGSRYERIWRKLQLCNSVIDADTVRILHIGDSHVKGKVFPHTVKEMLQNTFNKISYTEWGVDGATCSSFMVSTHLEKVSELRPDFVIVSFGTNESHDRHYMSKIHYSQIDKLISGLRALLPDATILLTTPPGSYLVSVRRRKKQYYVNFRTSKVADTIRLYAKEHNLWIWDLYNVAGGQHKACENWRKLGLMYSDKVHYSSKGYTLQGQLLYEAIIKAYKSYVLQ